MFAFRPQDTLQNNPWASPPTDVVSGGGLNSIVSYWEAIARSGFIVSWKLKVVLVGVVVISGKTSLVNGMTHGESRLSREDDRTKGVDVHVAEPYKPDAGQEHGLIFFTLLGTPSITLHIRSSCQKERFCYS